MLHTSGKQDVPGFSTAILDNRLAALRITEAAHPDSKQLRHLRLNPIWSLYE